MRRLSQQNIHLGKKEVLPPLSKPSSKTNTPKSARSKAVEEEINEAPVPTNEVKTEEVEVENQISSAKQEEVSAST